MHTNPFWQKSAQELLNYRPDQHVAATELSYDVWQNYHTDDPYNGPISDRIRAAEEMAQKVSADGVVLFCHWGCKETCGASPYIKQQLEAAGFPTLILNGDGVDRSQYLRRADFHPVRSVHGNAGRDEMIYTSCRYALEELMAGFQENPPSARSFSGRGLSVRIHVLIRICAAMPRR